MGSQTINGNGNFQAGRDINITDRKPDLKGPGIIDCPGCGCAVNKHIKKQNLQRLQGPLIVALIAIIGLFVVIPAPYSNYLIIPFFAVLLGIYGVGDQLSKIEI